MMGKLKKEWKRERKEMISIGKRMAHIMAHFGNHEGNQDWNKTSFELKELAIEYNGLFESLYSTGGCFASGKYYELKKSINTPPQFPEDRIG